MKTRVASNAYLLWLCPGCKLVHQIKFGEGPGPTWVWNHNRERPSISPSVMVRRTIGEEYIETVCHCYVTDGIIKRDAKARILRDGIIIYDGSIGSVAREKDQVKEVKQGLECGITIDGFNDIKEGDIIEDYEIVEIKR